MSLTFVKSNLSAFNGSGTTTGTAFTGGNTAGNLLVMGVRWTNGVTISSVSDTNLNTWVQIGSEYTHQGWNLAVFICLSNLATHANTVTVHWSAATAGDGMVVGEYSGQGSVPLDQFVNANGAASPVATGNLVANGTNETLFMMGSITGGLTIGTPSNGTIRSNANANDMFLVDTNETAAGTYSNGCTTSAEPWSIFYFGLSSATSAWSISGNAGEAGATVSYTGTASGSVTADGSGNYTITGLLNGGYTITPTLTGWTFSPTSSSQTVAGANITGVNFTATQVVVATPTFSPVAGSYGPAQTVTISSTDSGLGGFQMYYTTDGSTPTTGSTPYTTPITVSISETVKAIATATGYANSAVGSAAYVINGAVATPTFNPPAGTYTGTQLVTISTATAGASLFYTTDGTTPTTGSTPYTTPVSVAASLTVKALGTAAGFSNSAVGSAAYTIVSAPATRSSRSK